MNRRIMERRMFELRQRERREIHCRNEENKIDPDDGNLWTCGACNLPIFSTPFVNSTGSVYMHDRCANLPKELKDSDLHPNMSLVLTTSSHGDCSICKRHLPPSIMMYHCSTPPMSCGMQIHVSCALPTWIRILHRSHEHRLTVIRSRTTASFICTACGTRHDDDKYQPSSSSSHDDDQLIYVCSPCSFWIHPRCASLPNAVLLHHHDHQLHHDHPLILNYVKPTEEHSPTTLTCGICQGTIESLGMYSCHACRYSVHIMCTVSHPYSIQPVPIREARIPNLVRLPIANEHTSLIRHLTDITSSTCDDDVLEKLKYLHPHSLVLHHDDDDDDGNDDDPHLDRVCRACFQFIFPPFYRCSKCPKFFLHDFCARLPHYLTQHMDKNHPILLSPKAFSYSLSCRSCRNTFTHGLSYSCWICDIDLHVVCALMPALITHDAHATTHILYGKYFSDMINNDHYYYNYPIHATLTNPDRLKACDCCGKNLGGSVAYECRTCHGFIIHAVCAQLPRIVGHKYDEHPLKLVTTKRTPQSSHEPVFCEICEEEIEDYKVWYYSCNECDQSFHANCIPCLEQVKFVKEAWKKKHSE